MPQRRYYPRVIQNTPRPKEYLRTEDWTTSLRLEIDLVFANVTCADYVTNMIDQVILASAYFIDAAAEITGNLSGLELQLDNFLFSNMSIVKVYFANSSREASATAFPW